MQTDLSIERVTLTASAVRFLLVGAVNTLVGLSIIYLLKFLGIGDVVANASGYGIGVVVSFALNRNWTFQHVGPAIPAAARFLLVFAIAYIANLEAVLAMIHVLNANAYLAQALGVPVYTTLFYLGSRYFAFPR